MRVEAVTRNKPVFFQHIVEKKAYPYVGKISHLAKTRNRSQKKGKMHFDQKKMAIGFSRYFYSKLFLFNYIDYFSRTVSFCGISGNHKPPSANLAVLFFLMGLEPNVVGQRKHVWGLDLVHFLFCALNRTPP